MDWVHLAESFRMHLCKIPSNILMSTPCYSNFFPEDQTQFVHWGGFLHKYMPLLLLPYVLPLVMPFIFQVWPQCAQGQSDRVQLPITWYLLCSFGIGEFHHQLALVSHWSQGDIQVPLDYWALIWRSDFWKNQNILRLWALPSQDMILLTFTKY